MIKKIVETRRLPKTSTEVFKIVSDIMKMGWQVVPTTKGFGGTGAPAAMLEHMAKVKANNYDSPDLKDWELKFHGGGTLVTLLHKSPEPRGIMKQLVHEWGWEEKGQIAFRHKLKGKSDRGFYVVNNPDRIVIRHNTKDIIVPYWTH